MNRICAGALPTSETEIKANSETAEEGENGNSEFEPKTQIWFSCSASRDSSFLSTTLGSSRRIRFSVRK